MLAGCAGWGADGGGRSTPVTTAPAPAAVVTSPTRPWTAADLDDAIDRGVAFLAAHDELPDPVSLAIYDHLVRTFGTSALAGAVGEARRRGRPDGRDGMLWRLADPSASPPPLSTAPADQDEQRIGRALYCDERPLPEGYLAEVRAFSRRDLFGLNHGVLALQWARENRCPLPGADALRVEVATELRRRLSRERSVGDAEVCMSARLVYVGAADAIPASWIGRVIGAQQAGGAWPGTAGRTDQASWHTTLLAVWTLLGVRQPDTRGAMVPGADPAPAVRLPAG